MIRVARLITAAGAAMLAFAVGSAEAQTTWSGFYVGAQGGRGIQRDGERKFIRFDTNLDATFADTVRTAAGADAFSPGFCAGAAVSPTPGGGCTKAPKGVDAGGRLGYDWQAGPFVFGIVGDLGYQNASSSVAAFSVTPAQYTFTREATWLGGARARAGIAAGPVLLYGTGGGAWAGVDHRFNTSNAVNSFPETRNQGYASGYQAGGGAELRVGGKLSVGVEYLFTSLDDDERYVVRATGPAPATNPFILVNAGGTDLRRADRLEMNVLRAIASIRF